MSIALTKTQGQSIQAKLRTSKHNLTDWRIFRKCILGSSIVSAILIQGCWALAQMEPASTLTLQVPRTNEVIDASTWCQASDAVGTGRPFGFNRVRFSQEKTDQENHEFLIGCVTNNTQNLVEPIPVNYNLKYPPQTPKITGGFRYLDMPTLEPGETEFFKVDFIMYPEAIGIEIDLLRVVYRGQTMTYEPLERLVIQRRQ